MWVCVVTVYPDIRRTWSALAIQWAYQTPDPRLGARSLSVYQKLERAVLTRPKATVPAPTLASLVLGLYLALRTQQHFKVDAIVATILVRCRHLYCFWLLTCFRCRPLRQVLTINTVGA